jgi:hypothetical protein
MQVISQEVFQHDFTPLSIDDLSTFYIIFKEVGANSASKKYYASQCHFQAMERVLMKLMSVVWRAVMKMLFVHIA